jgi:hypothetical protein
MVTCRTWSVAHVLCLLPSLNLTHPLQTIDGKVYSGYLPFTDPYDVPPPARIVRKIPGDGPSPLFAFLPSQKIRRADLLLYLVLSITSNDLRCNVGGETAAGATAQASGGSTITWTMNRWPTDHHGPVTVYMASCGASCDTFDGSGNVWFKIDQAGLINATAQYWASDYLIANDLSWTAKIPDQIKPGQYLLRFELLALHDAGAPQMYPSCAQLDITSGGTDVPAANELASIPGIYKQGDPAIDGGVFLVRLISRVITEQRRYRYLEHWLHVLGNRRSSCSQNGC